MNARRILVLFALLAAASGSWQLARLLSRPPMEAAAPGLEHRGFYLRAASILGTGENGELLYRIDAEYAEQRSETEIDMQNVRVVYTSGAEVPWTLVADEASIGSELDRVSLSGNVMATSDQGFAGEVTEIRTERLEFLPDTYVAETDERVQIRIGSRSLTATGMLALLQDNRLQLKSNVSGKFLP